MRSLNIKVSESLYSKIETAAAIFNQSPAVAAREFLNEHTNILLFDDVLRVSGEEIEAIRQARRQATVGA